MVGRVLAKLRGGWGARGALFLALFSFFLLSGGRERPYADATPMWEVAESIVRRGSLSIRTAWPADLPRGRGGRIYAVAPLLQSLVHVPGAWGRWALGKIAPATAPYSMPLFSHLAPAALGAAACLTFWLLVGGLVGPLAAALSTGTLALGTYLWVYARSPYSEVLQATCFLLFLLALLRARAAPSTRSAVWLGAAAGALLASKLLYALALVGGMAWLAHGLLRAAWRRPVDLASAPAPAEAEATAAGPGGRPALLAALRLFGWVALGMAPFVLLVLGYNYLRWGSWLEAGYALNTTPGRVMLPVFGESLPVGLAGLFLSPGKSFFLYSPPLLVGLLGLPRLYRRAPAVVAALALTALPVVLLYGKFLFWAGDYAWGPRYLVFLAPLLMVPAAVVLDDVLAATHRWWRRALLAGLGLLAAVGIGVQVVGNSFIWDHHIRITRELSEAWLGRPNKTGAAVPEREGLCGACFEDMHRQQWLPAFQPIAGHLWLLRHVPRGHDWATAVKDTPWSRYTTVPFDVSGPYEAVRLDWWFLELRTLSLPLALVLLVLLTAGTAGGTRAFLRRWRRPPGAPAPTV